MFGHSPGEQRPLLHDGIHNSPYSGLGRHHHPHHDPHHGYRKRWYHSTWDSLNFHPAPIVQQKLPHTNTDVVVVERWSFCPLKALICSTMILTLIGGLIRHSTNGWAWGYKSQLASPQRWDIVLGNMNLNYPIPTGVNVSSCQYPLAYRGSGGATFQIPSSSEALLLFSDGRRLYGSVQITTTSAETDLVKFTVSLSSKRLPGYTAVCSLRRGDGDAGVGIFNPTNEEREIDDAIRYHVTVELPENHPVVKRFESNVINSRHDIDDLQGRIVFEALSLHGSNGGIYSKAVSARWADISTSDGPVDGYFNASDFLKIHTANGRMEVDVDFNQNASDKAVLSLLTSNNLLTANIRLYDTANSRTTPANFDVVTETSNGPLNIAFLDAPVDSRLSFHAYTTSIFPTEVTLHPTFEGNFSLRSFLFGTFLHQRSAVRDPSGRRRDRFVNYEDIPGHIDGNVTWGEEPKENGGRVDVNSSMGKVMLNL